MKKTFEANRVALRYIPSNNNPVAVGKMIFWTRARWEMIEQLFSDSVERIEELLEYRLRRTLHVVIYESNEEARVALNRNIGSTILLAPLHTPQFALVALHAPNVDPRNGLFCSLSSQDSNMSSS